MEYRSFFETGQGLGAVVATEQGVCRVILPGGDDVVELSGLRDIVSNQLTEQVAGLLKSYFSGERPDFNSIPVDLTAVTGFRSRILMLIRSIAYGEVKSYGQVAIMADAPRAARAIGGAMASNPVPIIIPCHRVVAANGRLTGFTAPGGLTLKKQLLKAEGAEFKGERVCLKIDGYKQAVLA